MHLSDNLRKMRKESGKTQKQIADQIGVSIKTWRNYENGVGEPTFTKLVKAVFFCGLNFESIKAFAIGDEATKDENEKPKLTEHVK